MHRNLAIILGLLVLLTITTPIFPVNQGESAPKIVLFDMEGGLVNTHSFKNQKYLILSFFLVPCPPCEKEIPHLQKLQDKYKGLRVVLISDYRTDSQKAKEFLDTIENKSKTKIKLPVLLDRYGDAAQGYKVIKNPTTFLIDKKGIVCLRIDGYTDDKIELLDDKVALLEKEQ